MNEVRIECSESDRVIIQLDQPIRKHFGPTVGIFQSADVVGDDPVPKHPVEPVFSTRRVRVEALLLWLPHRDQTSRRFVADSSGQECPACPPDIRPLVFGRVTEFVDGWADPAQRTRQIDGRDPALTVLAPPAETPFFDLLDRSNATRNGGPAGNR